MPPSLCSWTTISSMPFAWNDAINALVEFGGAIMCWLNVRALYRDKSLKGVTWQSQAWGLGWNAWHLVYYTTLSQTLSFMGELFGASAVLAWLALAWRYRKNT